MKISYNIDDHSRHIIINVVAMCSFLTRRWIEILTTWMSFMHCHGRLTCIRVWRLNRIGERVPQQWASAVVSCCVQGPVPVGDARGAGRAGVDAGAGRAAHARAARRRLRAAAAALQRPARQPPRAGLHQVRTHTYVPNYFKSFHPNRGNMGD